MATFGYEAVDRSGKILKGSVEADNQNLAKAELRKQGLTLVKLTEQNALTKDIEIDIGGKPTSRDLSVFCRQFVSITKAGVSILEALKMLCEQTENKKLKKALVEVRLNVEKGETLANAMSEHPTIFPTIMINMVAAGEASGSLEVSLERVAVQLERNNKTQALVKKAMIYPIILLFVSIAVVIVMLVVVIPSYSKIFEDLNTELPALTLGVLAASNFIKRRWYILLAIVVCATLGIRVFAKSNAGKHFFGKIKLTIPAMKNLEVKSASSLMARTLSTLIGAGVPLVEAVDIVSTVMGNIWYREALQEVKSQVILGTPLSRPLEECGLFPPMVYHMVRIGEESGNIEEMLDKLADYYDEEVEMAVQSLMAAMEPLMILVLAAIVSVLIASVLAPMMKMYEALDNL